MRANKFAILLNCYSAYVNTIRKLKIWRRSHPLVSLFTLHMLKLIVYSEAQHIPLLLSIASDISALIAEHCFEHLDGPIVRVASLETPIPFIGQLEDQYLAKNRFESELKSLLVY